MDELSAIVERAKSGPLGDADRETLRATFETLFALTNELETKGTSIRRLSCCSEAARARSWTRCFASASSP